MISPSYQSAGAVWAFYGQQQLSNGSAILVAPQGIDNGRFVTEIRVAPSLPMRFLTVRLVRSGERTFIFEGI